jgi:hypothetical protein
VLPVKRENLEVVEEEDAGQKEELSKEKESLSSALLWFSEAYDKSKVEIASLEKEREDLSRKLETAKKNVGAGNKGRSVSAEAAQKQLQTELDSSVAKEKKMRDAMSSLRVEKSKITKERDDLSRSMLEEQARLKQELQVEMEKSKQAMIAAAMGGKGGGGGGGGQQAVPPGAVYLHPDRIKEGWVVAYNGGRVYYQNNKTRQTSWTSPQAAAATPQAAAPQKPAVQLPKLNSRVKVLWKSLGYSYAGKITKVTSTSASVSYDDGDKGEITADSIKKGDTWEYENKQQQQQQRLQQQSGGTWACLLCTQQNSAGSKFCVTCGRAKGTHTANTPFAS